jgi:hypothetical protein
MSPRRAPAAAKKLSAPMPRPKSAPVTRSRAKSPFLLAGRPAPSGSSTATWTGPPGRTCASRAVLLRFQPSEGSG